MDHTAEAVFSIFSKLPAEERSKFYALLGESTGIRKENFSYDEVFGHLAEEEFTSTDAADYLDVSMSTFRRYVKDGRISPSSEMGRNQLFAATVLQQFQKSLKAVKGA